MPAINKEKNRPKVGKVPEDYGMIFCLAMAPAQPKMQMMTINLPKNMHKPVAILKNGVLAFKPAKAEPLLLAAELNAYRYSLKP